MADDTQNDQQQQDPECELEKTEKEVHFVPAAGRTPQRSGADPAAAVGADVRIRLRGYKFLPALLAFESFSKVFIRDFILGFALPAFTSHFSGSFLVLLPRHGEGMGGISHEVLFFLLDYQ